MLDLQLIILSITFGVVVTLLCLFFIRDTIIARMLNSITIKAVQVKPSIDPESIQHIEQLMSCYIDIIETSKDLLTFYTKNGNDLNFSPEFKIEINTLLSRVDKVMDTLNQVSQSLKGGDYDD